MPELPLFLHLFIVISLPILLAIFTYINPSVSFTRKITAIVYWLELATINYAILWASSVWTNRADFH